LPIKWGKKEFIKCMAYKCISIYIYIYIWGYGYGDIALHILCGQPMGQKKKKKKPKMFIAADYVTGRFAVFDRRLVSPFCICFSHVLV